MEEEENGGREVMKPIYITLVILYSHLVCISFGAFHILLEACFNLIKLIMIIIQTTYHQYYFHFF